MDLNNISITYYGAVVNKSKKSSCTSTLVALNIRKSSQLNLLRRILKTACLKSFGSFQPLLTIVMIFLLLDKML